MRPNQRSVAAALAALSTLCAVGCTSSGSPSGAEDAATDGGAAGASGSSGGSGSGGSSGSTGSSASSGSSGSAGSGSGSGSGGSSGTSGSGGDSGTCNTNADCGTGHLCGFLRSAGCSAVGTCFPASGVVCNAILLACACDGTSINVACNGLPGGYTPRPYAHAGTCGLDSGGGD